MSKKPNRATGYDSRHVDHVRAACLYVATKLGDLIDETVIAHCRYLAPRRALFGLHRLIRRTIRGLGYTRRALDKELWLPLP